MPNFTAPAKLKADLYPKTYDDACAIAQRARGDSGKKIGHNTYVQDACEYEKGTGKRIVTYVVRFHYTDIITFYPDGSIKLNTNGWQTYTTRVRMEACGIGIGVAGGIVSVAHKRRHYVYRDGMVLRPNGTASGHGGTDPDELRRIRRNALARDRRANRWAHPRWNTRCASERWEGGNAPEAFDDGRGLRAAPEAPALDTAEPDPTSSQYAPGWAPNLRLIKGEKH
jgi:hypothetical protein